MSDLEAMGNPEHRCTDVCAPYEPLADRDLEHLEESAHIDALYEELNLVREHAALLIVVLAKLTGPTVSLTPRSLAILLDVSETEAMCLLGEGRHKPAAIVDHAINVSGEDGYVGQAMAALFRLELFRATAVPDDDQS